MGRLDDNSLSQNRFRLRIPFLLLIPHENKPQKSPPRLRGGTKGGGDNSDYFHVAECSSLHDYSRERILFLNSMFLPVFPSDRSCRQDTILFFGLTTECQTGMFDLPILVIGSPENRGEKLFAHKSYPAGLENIINFGSA